MTENRVRFENTRKALWLSDSDVDRYASWLGHLKTWTRRLYSHYSDLLLYESKLKENKADDLHKKLFTYSLYDVRWRVSLIQGVYRQVFDQIVRMNIDRAFNADLGDIFLSIPETFEIEIPGFFVPEVFVSEYREQRGTFVRILMDHVKASKMTLLIEDAYYMTPLERMYEEELVREGFIEGKRSTHSPTSRETCKRILKAASGVVLLVHDIPQVDLPSFISGTWLLYGAFEGLQLPRRRDMRQRRLDNNRWRE